MASVNPVITKIAIKEGGQQILPEKAHGRSVQAYQKFLQWQKSQNTDSFGEEVLLEYFREAAKTYTPSSLWSIYSSLEPIIKANHNVIIRYGPLIAFLQLADCRNKKSNGFNGDEIMKFLMEAPDDEYLAIKTVALFGVCGGCYDDDLTNITMDHIMDCKNGILVRIPDLKNKVIKKFAIGGVFAVIVRKYLRLRPSQVSTDRFFIHYRGGKCIAQAIGKNAIARMSQKIAEFLEYPDPTSYTRLYIQNHAPNPTPQIFADAGVTFEKITTSDGEGYSFKGSSASILANRRAGAASKITQSDVEESFHYKQTTGGFIKSTIVSPSIGASVGYNENVGDDSVIPNAELSDALIIGFSNATSANIPSSEDTCLLCLSTRKATINFYSEQGRELDIISILATHFWFQLEDQTVQNICYDCWKDTESFHKFYTSIQIAHRILEADLDQIDSHTNNLKDDDEICQPDEELDEKYIPEIVKIENVTSDGEIYQFVQVPNEGFTKEIVKIECDEDVKDDKETNQPSQVSDVKDDEEIDRSIQESNIKDEGEIDLVPVKDSIEEVEIESDVEVYEEIDQLAQVTDDNFKTDVVEIESDDEVEHDQDITQPIEIDSDDDIEEVESCEIQQTNSIQAIAFDGLPKESQEHHLGAYNKFMAWKISKNIDKGCFSEAALFEYFNGLKTTLQSTTLWTQYSLLKTTIQKVHNIYVCYPKVTELLKDGSTFGYQNQIEKSNVFQAHQLERFFAEAPDIEFLATKVIMIFLMNGVSTDGLTKIEVKDVIEQGSKFVITFPKTKGIGSFILENEYATYVRKYRQLRPPHVPHDRFFVTYQKGKCIAQPTGRTKILNAPKSVAQFLKLKNAKRYSSLSIDKESIPKKICGPNSEKIKRPTESIFTSTIASSGETFTISLCEDAEAIAFDLLPEHAQRRHLSSYNKFMTWKDGQNIDKESFTAEVLVEYFKSMKTKYKPTSLWVEYSTLRTTIQKMHNIDITCSEIQAFLRTNSSGYQPKKLSVFQSDEMQRFLNEADDNEFLAVKVIMIFGIFSVTGEILTKVTVDDVTEQGSVFIVNVSDAKTNSIRSFTVENELATFFRKYKQLRPQKVDHNRFFLNYENGRCTVQAISRGRFQTAAKIIANFLNLKDPENYTGQSFSRRRIRNRGIRAGVLDVEECTPSKRVKVGDGNAEHIHFEPSTEALTSSVDITVASASTIPNTFQIAPQIYHVESHQAQTYGISTTTLQANDVYVLPDDR